MSFFSLMMNHIIKTWWEKLLHLSFPRLQVIRKDDKTKIENEIVHLLYCWFIMHCHLVLTGGETLLYWPSSLSVSYSPLSIQHHQNKTKPTSYPNNKNRIQIEDWTYFDLGWTKKSNFKWTKEEHHRWQWIVLMNQVW